MLQPIWLSPRPKSLIQSRTIFNVLTTKAHLLPNEKDAVEARRARVVAHPHGAEGNHRLFERRAELRHPPRSGSQKRDDLVGPLFGEVSCIRDREDTLRNQA